MAANRFLYAAILFGCGIFYIAYGKWLAIVVLAVVLVLPWLSLLVSLPAMLSFRASIGGPDWVNMGEMPELYLLGSCRFPMPPFRGNLALRRSFTGKRHRYREGDVLTDHCGAFAVTAERVRVCDYLGLFAMPVWKKEGKQLLVRPAPLPVPLTEALNRRSVRAWKPKFGGGFAENHELRLYRPGDSLNQVHWKLSAKTGKLTIRQPMEPVREIYLLTMNLSGSPEELDWKFGRLLWLGRELLRRELPFEIRCLTADGILFFPVDTASALQRAVDALLTRSLAVEGDIREREFSASWHHHIGGQPDEA